MPQLLWTLDRVPSQPAVPPLVTRRYSSLGGTRPAVGLRSWQKAPIPRCRWTSFDISFANSGCLDVRDLYTYIAKTTVLTNMNSYSHCMCVFCLFLNKVLRSTARSILVILVKSALLCSNSAVTLMSTTSRAGHYVLQFMSIEKYLYFQLESERSVRSQLIGVKKRKVHDGTVFHMQWFCVTKWFE